MLTQNQRAYLRKIIQEETAIYQIGKKGLSKTQIEKLSEALEARELIKIKVLTTAPEEKEELANTIAKETDSELVGSIGNKLIFYRESKKNKKIILPTK